MENRNDWNRAQDASNPENEWRSAENSNEQWQQSGALEDEETKFDATSEEYANETDDTLYAGSGDEDDDDDDLDDDNDDDDDDDDDSGDWGTVDPQGGPGLVRDPMDPSGPGSAV